MSTHPPTSTDPLLERLLDLADTLLKAQLKAVAAFRNRPQPEPRLGARAKSLKGRYSQVDLAFDLLKAAAAPLHVSAIIERARSAGHSLDRESLVSALTKRVTRKDRFTRTAPNTFALLPDALL